MPSVDEVKSQLANTLPSDLHDEAAHLVEQAARYDNGRMTSEELLNLLVADDRIAHLLGQMAQQVQSGGVNLGAGTSVGQMGDAVAGDKVGGDSITGDKVGGDKVGGDAIAGNKFDIHLEDISDPKKLIEFLRGLDATEGDAGNQHDAAIEQYQQQFIAALGSLTAPKYIFPLTVRLISPQRATPDSDTGMSLEQLIARIQTSRMIIMRGSAGSGKSTCMRRLAEVLIDDRRSNIVPIFLQLRELKPEMLARAGEAVPDDAAPEQYIEPLLDASIVPLGIADLKTIGEHALSMNNGLILLMADGLNELYGEDMTNLILKRLVAYVTRRGLGARVLVSDRITPRDVIDAKWQQLRIEQLTPEVVLQQFQSYGMDAFYHELNAPDRTLLQTPYFLSYALEHNATRLSSAAEAIKAFFESQGFNGETLDRMARAAFDAYNDYHSYKFDVSHFIHAVGDDVYRKLVDEGILLVLPDQGEAQVTQTSTEPQVQFDHPLKHDYLAARYLAQHDTEWTPASLDVVSFESNSFDALAMTLELLQDEAECDTFIQRVHNWNWAAALICIAKAVRSGSGRHSQEIQFAVLALVTEKLFDPVQQTRARANEVLALFPQTIAAPYNQVRDLGELRALVEQQVQAENAQPEHEPWFPKWCDLFVRFDSPIFSETDLQQIVRQEALIGWTAANVLRRFKLSELDVRQLRAYYDACNACDYGDWRASTIRSRVVHALGQTDTRAVVDLLFKALSDDRYIWARIGAARSLVEIGALTADAELRRHVIDTLLDMVDTFAKEKKEILAMKTLHEIGQSAFYRDAHPGWQAAVTPLISLVRDRQNDPERDWWSNLLVEFEKFCQDHVERAVGS
jgi:hypothetical protein